MAGRKLRDNTDDSGVKTRREQLINAAIEAIAEYGLSNVTLAKVAGLAGLTAAMVNFHFKSKDALLLESLVFLTDEFHAVLQRVIKETGDDPVLALEAMIDANFDRVITNPHKVAVWYAFWGEAGARADYMKVCEVMDNAYRDTFLTLIQDVAKEVERPVDAEAVALGLIGLIDGQWQQLLIEQDSFDHDKARHLCTGYLASVFPGHFQMATRRGEPGIRMRVPSTPYKVDSELADENTQYTLPGWVYHTQEYFAVEKDRIHETAWQFICHENDIPKAGDYKTLDILGKTIFAVRAKDGNINAFHNVCRHRAHAIVEGDKGNCPGALRCSYHGWAYNYEGKLKGVPDEDGFPSLDKKNLGLYPADIENFMGFLFIRLKSEGPSVSERFASMVDDFACYRTKEMQPLYDSHIKEAGGDWKNVWDNYLEGYHFRSSHPGLNQLMEANYEVSANLVERTARLSHQIKDGDIAAWSLRHYQKIRPEMSHLPERLKNSWQYFFLYPAISFDIMPETIGVFQVIPQSAGKSVLRYNQYGLPDDRRETKLTRYLNIRINTEVQKEDDRLVKSVQKGLESGSYQRGILSSQETIVSSFQQWVINDAPVADLDQAPKAGSINRRNAEMKLPLSTEK